MMDSALNDTHGSTLGTDRSLAHGTEIYVPTASDAVAPRIGIQTGQCRATDFPRRERLLFIVNVAWFFKSHRLALAMGAIERGYEVHLAASFESQDERMQFETLGIVTHDVPFERSGTSIVAEMKLVLQLRRLLASVRPQLLHNVSIKPVIYGGFLGRWQKIPTVSAISGLGYSYIAKGFKANLRRSALDHAYAMAVNGARSRVIVQNEDDYAFFDTELNIPKNKLTLIKGSGVDLRQFDPATRPSQPSIVVLVARMLVDKGVREFAAAAKILKQRGSTARFVLVGGLDLDNRAGLTQSEIDQLVAEGSVEYWGHRSDIPAVLASARIVCLPSYREGFPKSLLEAAAAARAIVSTDVPGCREIVNHGENGFLVPARDPAALAEAIGKLLEDDALCTKMGSIGRDMVEKHFSIDIVVRQTMNLYEELLR